MDKIKTVKIKELDGSISEETYTISVDAKNVDMKNGKDLQDTIGDINVDNNGNISQQLNKIKKDIVKKANETDIPTAVSQLENDSNYLIEDDLQMINTIDIQNDSQIIDATSYGRLNKIYGDTEQNGTPTPDNSVDIEVVTGDIDISVSDSNNTSEQTYTLPLGNIELCKIDNYQDYIYYYNGDWYYHKEILKLDMSNIANWGLQSAGKFYRTNFNIVYGIKSGKVFSNIFNYSNVAWSDDYKIGITSSNNLWITTGNNTLTTSNDLSAWLENKNAIMYGVLSTPSDTKITDVTLINALNEIRNFGLFPNETNFVITSDGLTPKLNITYAITDRDFYSKEEVNDKVDNLKKDINKIKDKVQFIFPKFWANASSGDINIIKYDDNIIMIDCESSTRWNDVRQMLIDNNISHIDYFILTHYHSDHYGNIKNLFENNYIDRTTNFYMPADVTAWSGITSMITEYKNYFSTNGLTYYIPSENEVLNINELKLKFYNTDSTVCNLYYELDQYHDYNPTSTIVLLTYKDTNVLYTGDASGLTYKRLREDNFVKGKIDLFKIGHHGINVTTDLTFIRNISPNFAVQQGGIIDFETNNFDMCSETSLLASMGALIYSTFMQDDYIKFVSNGSSIKCVNGKPYYISHYKEDIDLYVDINTDSDSIQDGSQEHPFKELMQAIGSIDYKHVSTAIIHLADGFYCNYDSTANSWKDALRICNTKTTRITIQGNSSNRNSVRIRRCSIENANIIFKNLTIDISDYDGIYAYNSNIILNNILIDTAKSGILSTTHSGVITRENTNLFIVDSRINNANYGISIINSSCSINGLSFGSINNKPISIINTKMITANITFDNENDKLNFDTSYAQVKDPEVLLDTATSTTGTLKKSISNYDWIEIEYKSGDNIYNSTGRIKRIGTSQTFSGIITHASAGGSIYNTQGEFVLNGTNLTVQRLMSINITPQGAITISQSQDSITVIRVIGGFNDLRIL